MLRQSGMTLLEVMIAMLVSSFGVLALASLQAKLQVDGIDNYQRAQAIILTQDMVERIQLNGLNGQQYALGLGSPLGTGDDQPADCDALLTIVERDLCRWSAQLKGAAETIGTQNVGAMIDARGCIEQTQLADPTAGVCTPAIFRVTTVWQGLKTTTEPVLQCGAGLYGEAGYRRLVSFPVLIGLPTCE